MCGEGKFTTLMIAFFSIIGTQCKHSSLQSTEVHESLKRSISCSSQSVLCYVLNSFAAVEAESKAIKFYKLQCFKTWLDCVNWTSIWK